uniref:Uncharacterized protein n=1 Tax=Anguilla anguilla TaxID=7936 RepID=A0A0E9RKD7_ANGAN
MFAVCIPKSTVWTVLNRRN